jgi:hypothetical protein
MDRQENTNATRSHRLRTHLPEKRSLRLIARCRGTFPFRVTQHEFNAKGHFKVQGTI